VPAGWLVLGFLIGFGVGIVAWRLIQGRRQRGYLAQCEYWVYVRRPAVPKTEALMSRMIDGNPHNRPGKPCITNREGMLFTDVRLHVAAVLKSKNPQLFRPDLFDRTVVPTPEILERLALCEGLIRVRYLSEVPLKDSRHLQFIPHMADAVSDLCEGLVVLDTVSNEMVLAEEFTRRLSVNGHCERPDFHLRVLWDKLDEGCRALSCGLVKVGRKDWVSDWLDADQEVLATGLMLNASHKVFRKPEEPGPFEMEAYGDTLILEVLGAWEEGRQKVSIKRRMLS
jgi:hypothetical protein